MGRHQRSDGPGYLHHVGVRGSSGQPIFGSDEQKQWLLERLREETGAGRIAVVAFCILNNHWHAVIRSLRGELSSAMHRINSWHARMFNVHAGRTGPLLEGRFWNDVIGDEVHAFRVVRYVEHNAVRAGLGESFGDYVFGSAHGHLKGKPLEWLDREWMAEELDWLLRQGHSWASAFSERFGEEPNESEIWCAERSLWDSRSRVSSAIGARDCPERIWRRFEERIEAGDGLQPPLPAISPDRLETELAHLSRRQPNVQRFIDAQPSILSGLFFELSGLRVREIAERESISYPAARMRLLRFRTLLATRAGFRNDATRICHEILQAALPSKRRFHPVPGTK